MSNLVHQSGYPSKDGGDGSSLLIRDVKSAGDRRRGRILIVDGDHESRERVGGVLDGAGYETLSAGTVADGLRLARSQIFDLILLDWLLTDGTGIDLCEAIRAFDTETLVLFCIGADGFGEIREAVKAGAQGCFVKPVQSDLVIQTILTATRL